jgi:hypothetical protein
MLYSHLPIFKSIWPHTQRGARKLIQGSLQFMMLGKLVCRVFVREAQPSPVEKIHEPCSHPQRVGPCGLGLNSRFVPTTCRFNRVNGTQWMDFFFIPQIVHTRIWTLVGGFAPKGSNQLSYCQFAWIALDLANIESNECISWPSKNLSPCCI